MKKSAAPPPEAPKRPWLPEQPDPTTLDLSTLTPLSPEVIARQATQNIGTIGKAAIGRTCHSRARLLTKFEFNRARRTR
jgi:translation initiation factor 2 subunit 3